MFAIVEICSPPVNRRGTSAKTGKEYNIWFQEAFLHLASSPYPQRFEFLVRDGVILDKGRYAITASAFFIDRDARIALRLEDGLQPIDAAVAGAVTQGKDLKVAA